MTLAQQADAELLRSLGRPAEAISANSQIDLPTIKAWLRSGKWPKSTSTQLELFDAGATSKKTQPATALDGNHGLSLFARAD